MSYFSRIFLKDWHPTRAQQIRKGNRHAHRDTYRRRLGFEKLEDIITMASDVEVGGMTFSVIDDLDPGYTESAFGEAKIVDNDS
ncbi:MAG: hypothetical protein IT356_13040, partial [Gemmatimonadaceae bacterium]|nr:hypothetical protein [Gemmatimonadaceae bacterium]